MRCKFILSVLVWLSVDAYVGVTQDDLKSQVYDGIADFVVNRDAINRRFAFMAYGESWQEPPKKVRRAYPVCFMQIKANDEFDYYAMGIPLANHNPLEQNETWDQHLQIRGKHWIKSGTIRPDKIYVPKPDGIRLGEFQAKQGYHPLYFEPLDDILMMASFLIHSEPSPRAAEKVFLGDAELLTVTKSVQGAVESTWHWRWGDFDLDIELTQSSAHGNMPLRVAYKDRQAKYKNFFSETFIDWEQKGEAWVPTRINAATVFNAMRPEPTGVQIYLKLDWLVGDEVKPEMVEPAAVDHRVPLMNAFGRYFDMIADGRTVAGEEWTRPDDLHIEAATKALEKHRK